MRKGEILKLELKHVDLRNKAINLSGKMTKSGEDRTIPLNEAALEVLVEHLRKNTSPKAVFKTNNFRTAWQNVLKRAGVHGATFHDLRRTFATYLKDGGVSLYSIKELLGHSSIIMTERYLASQGTVLAESVEKINFI